MNLKDIRKEARYLLKGSWLKLSLIVFIFNLFILFVYAAPNILNFSSTVLILAVAVIGLISTIFVIPFIYGLFSVIIKSINGEKVRLLEFVSTGIKNFKKSYFLIFGIVISLAVPILAFIISAVFLDYGIRHFLTFIITTGGIIYTIATFFMFAKAFYYIPSFFVMIDNEEKSVKDILNESKEIMTLERVNLLKLFGIFALFFIIMLGISFGAGIIFHSQDAYAIVATIGYMILFPYFIVSLYVFYKYKKDPHYKFIYEEHVKEQENKKESKKENKDKVENKSKKSEKKNKKNK